MTETIVDAMYRDNLTLANHLTSIGEVSLRVTADDYFRKVLLLSAASYFEHKVSETLLEFVFERTRGDGAILALVRSKAIERQYHTFFDWKSNNANTFFSLFGPHFKDYMKTQVEKDDGLRDAIRAFLEIGRLRNELVHLNFASFPLEKTVEEIYDLYKIANRFVVCLPDRLRDPIDGAQSSKVV